MMTTSMKSILAGLLCSVLLPAAAMAQAEPARELTQAELEQLVEQARRDGVPADTSNVDVQYVGGSTAPVDTVYCCSAVEEQVSEQVQVQETTTYIDAVTNREVIQPVEKTLIQPVERRIARGTSETVTNDTRFERDVLPARVERDPVPQTVENVVVEETVETRQDVTETYYDVLARREVIQPVERTVVVPVERQIVRPRTETIRAEPRYETVTEGVRIEADPIPQTVETVVPQVRTNTVEEVSETYVDYVARRDVIQPVERTLVQPVERVIVRGQSETVTAPTRYEQEVLPVRVEDQGAPGMIENVTEQVSERVVYEVQDVYVDQVTRNVIQPVVVTRVQPVEYRRVRGQSETVTAPTVYETEYLPARVEADTVPQTEVVVREDVRTNTVEEVSETYMDVVTQRTVIQPVVRTQVQPVEIRRARPQTETVTAPVRYETVRAGSIAMAAPTTCGCAAPGGIQASTAHPVTVAQGDCNTTKTASADVAKTSDGRRMLTW